MGFDSYSSKNENFILIGDFNSEPKETIMKDFCESYNFKNLVKEPTCYKNPKNPSLIDLILTNCPRSFQNTTTVETGLSDFHKMTLTVLKTHFEKLPPQIIAYRDYNKYDYNTYRKELMEILSSHDLSITSLELFKEIALEVLNKHAPIKKKSVRGNNGKFMTKELRSAIMNGS